MAFVRATGVAVLGANEENTRFAQGSSNIVQTEVEQGYEGRIGHDQTCGPAVQ